MGSDEIKLFDVRTAEEFRRLGFTAESIPAIRIEPQEVPETLRHLIQLVERWAIGCDVRRGDYFDKQPEQDVRAFWEAVEPYRDEINRWLNSLPEAASQWPAAAIHFLCMLKAHSEAVPPEVLAQLAGHGKIK